MSWTWMHNQFGFHIQILIQKQLSFFEFIVKELKKMKRKRERYFLALRVLKERWSKLLLYGHNLASKPKMYRVLFQRAQYNPFVENGLETRALANQTIDQHV